MKILQNLLNNHWNSRLILRIIAVVALIGIIDTAYLTANYYFGSETKCLITEGCEIVLTSQYSKILGIPLSVLGLVFYAGIFILVSMVDIYNSELILKFLIAGGVIGFGMSLVFLYIQLFLLEALCFYCLISFSSSTVVFASGVVLYIKGLNK